MMRSMMMNPMMSGMNGMYGMNPMMNPMNTMMNPMMNPMFNPMMGMMNGRDFTQTRVDENGKKTHIHHHFGDEKVNHHFKGRHHPKINIYTNPKRVLVPPPTTPHPSAAPTPRAVPLIQIEDESDSNDMAKAPRG